MSNNPIVQRVLELYVPKTDGERKFFDLHTVKKVNNDPKTNLDSTFKGKTKVDHSIKINKKESDDFDKQGEQYDDQVAEAFGLTEGKNDWEVKGSINKLSGLKEGPVVVVKLKDGQKKIGLVRRTNQLGQDKDNKNAKEYSKSFLIKHKKTGLHHVVYTAAGAPRIRAYGHDDKELTKKLQAYLEENLNYTYEIGQGVFIGESKINESIKLETPDHKIEHDNMGHVLLTHKPTNKSVYLQGDHATDFIRILNRMKTNKVPENMIDHDLSSYHNVMEEFNIPESLEINEISIQTHWNYLKANSNDKSGKDRSKFISKSKAVIDKYDADQKAEHERKQKEPLKYEPKVHDFSKYHPDNHGGAYDRTQTDESIRDGDVMHFGKGHSAVMMQAWPTMVTGKSNAFHSLADGHSWDKMDDGKYAKSAALARKTAGVNESLSVELPVFEQIELNADSGKDFDITFQNGDVTTLTTEEAQSILENIELDQEELSDSLDSFNEEIKGWKNAGRDINKYRSKQADGKKSVHTITLKKDGKESGMHDAKKMHNSLEDAEKHMDYIRSVNPGRKFDWNVYTDNKLHSKNEKE